MRRVLARSLLLSPEDRERIAYHESGLAVLAVLVPGADQECHDEAKALLVSHRLALDQLVRARLARETLDEHEILEVTGLPPAQPLRNTPIAAEATLAR